MVQNDSITIGLCRLGMRSKLGGGLLTAIIQYGTLPDRLSVTVVGGDSYQRT